MRGTSGIGIVAVLAVATGCEKKESRISGPMPVTLGDCAGPNTAWASGFKPAPFLPEEAKDVQPYTPMTASNEPTEAKPAPSASQDDPPPPEEEDKPDDGADESGGTGTAMALDEGKMGKKDSDRAEGQYKMKKNQTDEELARQQAIEQARNAGILGPAAQAEGGAFASLTGTGDISSGFDDTNIYGGLLGNEAGEMNGGFGPGGGGTGWGTIGTGRYGTIGHGAGTGSGYGVGSGRGGMRGRSAAVPTVSIGQPNAQGDLDKAIIRRYIKRNIQKIQYCYEKELLAKPNLSGTVQTQFFITPNGDVASSTGSGVDPNVANCVADVIKAITFPKPKGGGGVQVNYPFTFRPAGGGDGTTTVKATPPSPPDSGSAADAGSAGSANVPAVGGGSAAPPANAKAPPPIPPGGYKTGKGNPLQIDPEGLEACFRKGKHKFGVAVFDFAYDAGGKVTTVDVHGLEDANVKACVISLAKKKVTSIGGQKAERCSVGFGVMPIADAPSIEVNSNAVMFNGAKHGSIAELTAEDSFQFKIPSLFDSLDERERRARAAVVSLMGPIIIKAIDTAKMKVVNKVMATVRASGGDFVLAQQQGPDWKPLHPIELPQVPVPFGTGQPYSYNIIRNAGLDWESEAVHLSVLVQAERIWVGLSRVNEFQEVPRDFAKLEQVLKDQKASAFFSDRVDIEIAGDADASYIDVINTIKAAEAAGFLKWQVGDPMGLSARPTL